MISRNPRVSSIAAVISQIILAFTLFSDSPVAEAQDRIRQELQSGGK